MKFDYQVNICPRVRMRMECPKCGYPISEAAVPLDPDVPHMSEVDLDHLLDGDPTYLMRRLGLVREG